MCNRYWWGSEQANEQKLKLNKTKSQLIFLILVIKMKCQVDGEAICLIIVYSSTQWGSHFFYFSYYITTMNVVASFFARTTFAILLVGSCGGRINANTPIHTHTHTHTRTNTHLVREEQHIQTRHSVTIQLRHNSYNSFDVFYISNIHRAVFPFSYTAAKPVTNDGVRDQLHMRNSVYAMVMSIV